MNGNASGLSEYVVICQAKTSAQFGDDYDSLVITNAATDFGSAQVTYRTHYEPNEENFRIPRQLYAEIRGYAPSLKDAVNIFWNTANRYIPVISFSVNAHIDDLEVEIGFDNSPNLMEREFFQSVIPREIGMPKGKRIINVPLTIALLDCIAKHPERDLLLRAINQYRTALMYWKPAHETFAVSHLFMSAEALKLGVLNNYLRQSGLNIVDVAKSWGIPIKANINKAYTLKQNTIKSSVEAHLRRTIIFQNDTHCHNAAKDASDGFEHGSENYEEIYKLAVESRNQTAKYLRSAILNFANTQDASLLALENPPYDLPLETFRMTRYLRGYLKGTSDQLAQDGFDYPWMEINTKIKPVADSIDGKTISFDENITPHIGKDIVFQPISYEVWGPNIPQKRDVTEDKKS